MDLRLFFHAAAIRASANFSLSCTWVARGDLRSWLGLRRQSLVAMILAAKAIGVRYLRDECALEIVIRSPCRKLASGLIETEEECLFQKLITLEPVEALDEPVLHRLSEFVEVPVDLVVLAPGEHGVAGKLSSIVTDNHARFATLFDHRRQLTRHALCRDRRVRDRAEASLGHVVDHVQDTEAPTVDELVMHEVGRPAGICLHLDEDWSPGPDCLAPRPSFAHQKAFFLIEPVVKVDARGLALPPQKDEQPTIAKPTPLVCEVAQPRAKFGVWRAARTVADHLTVRSYNAAGPTIRQAHHSLQVRYRVALYGGPYHFFREAPAWQPRPASVRLAASAVWLSPPQAA